MRNLILYTAIALLFTACGDTANTNKLANTAANAANTVANVAANAANTLANAVSGVTTASPETFMKEAAQGGKAEVEMGTLAASKAANPELKKFGQMMVTDHTAAGKDLVAVAKKKNFTLPTDTGSHQPIMDKLKGLSGADFDRYYVEQMVQDHEADLRTFQKQAESGSDADVKAFAAKVVPVIQKHLDAIKAIQAKMK
jgi:putative membrane protein